MIFWGVVIFVILSVMVILAALAQAGRDEKEFNDWFWD